MYRNIFIFVLTGRLLFILLGLQVIMMMTMTITIIIIIIIIINIVYYVLL